MGFTVHTGNQGFVGRTRLSKGGYISIEHDSANEDDEWSLYDGEGKVAGPFPISGQPIRDIEAMIKKHSKGKPESVPIRSEPKVAPKSAPAPKEDKPVPTELPAIAPTLDTLTAEIQILKRQTAANIIEIGKRLIEAKEMVGHGNWLRYLEYRVQFTERTAQRFMRAATEMGNTTSLSLLEPTKALLLLEAPEEVREGLAEKASDMTTRQLAEAVRKVNDAERKANEAESQAAAERKRAEEAEARAKAAESRQPEVIKEQVEVKVYELSPEVQMEIDNLRRSLAEKDRTLEQHRKDYDRVSKILSEASRDLDKLRQQADKNGTLDAEIRQKEQQLKQLAALQQKIGANFDDEGLDPKGGFKLLTAIRTIDDAILKTIGDVQLLKRAGVGGWCEDDRLKELSGRLKQLANLLDAILEDRTKMPLKADFKEVD